MDFTGMMMQDIFRAMTDERNRAFEHERRQRELRRQRTAELSASVPPQQARAAEHVCVGPVTRGCCQT